MKTLELRVTRRERRELDGGERKKTYVVKIFFEINSIKWFATTCILFVHVCACKYGVGWMHKNKKMC